MWKISPLATFFYQGTHKKGSYHFWSFLSIFIAGFKFSSTGCLICIWTILEYPWGIQVLWYCNFENKLWKTYILSIVFVKMRFQYLKHSLQKRMVYHSNQLLEAIIKLWQRGYPYSRIVNIINDSAIAQISKRTVAYQVKKFQETESVETMRTASICEDA